VARWLILRTLSAAAVVVATIVACSALIAIFVPDEAPRPGLWSGTVEGVRLKLLHGDFGVWHVEPGTVPVRTLFTRGLAVDLTLIAGGLVAGTALGMLGGRVSAARPRSRAARMLDGLASVALCLPVYVAGYGLLQLFAPSFGAVAHVHGWVEAGRYEPLTSDPWHWLQAMAIPWILVGLPIAAIALRLTAAGTLDNLETPFARTATAFGVPRRRVLAAAARPTYGPTAAGLGTQVRAVVFNVMFVEYVFFLPGFLWYTKRAIGNDPPNWIVPDIGTLAALAVWSAVLVATLSLVADVIAVALDPQVTARGR
jgi:peptide/nickel transport system permease protein